MSTTNETAIRQLIADWEIAARTHDIEGVMAYHTSDMLAFDVPPPDQIKGADAYRKHWETCFTYFQGPGIFEVTELNVTAGEEVAFATCITHCGGTQLNGETCQGTARATLGFRKIDGQWMFTHEHHSMPISMGDETSEVKS